MELEIIKNEDFFTKKSLFVFIQIWISSTFFLTIPSPQKVREFLLALHETISRINQKVLGKFG